MDGNQLVHYCLDQVPLGFCIKHGTSGRGIPQNKLSNQLLK